MKSKTIGFACVSLLWAVCAAGCGDEGDTINTYVIASPVEVQSDVLTDAVEGSAYAFALTASGGSNSYDWTLEPGCTNNSWLALDAGTGGVSGTPGFADVGTVIMMVRASDGEDPSNFDVKSFSFLVKPDLSIVRITTQGLPDVFVNATYSKQLAAQGGSGSFKWYKLPGGINDSWTVVYDTSGFITGNPATDNKGLVRLNILVVDGENPDLFDTATFDLYVFDGTISILNSDPALNAASSCAYSFMLRAEGGSGSYSWIKDGGGTNDSWIAINSSTGAVTGTAPGSAGSVTLRIRVFDALNSFINAVKEFHFDIKTMALTVEPLPNAFMGITYSQALGTIGGTGGALYSIEPGGENYSWLSINGSSIECPAGPSASELGPVTVVVRATDGSLMDARAYEFGVYPVPVIFPHLPDGQVGVGYSVIPQVSGGSGRFVWSLESGGANYSWISIDAVTGRLSGTPTDSDTGPVTVVVKVGEKSSPTVYDQASISFEVMGISIDTAELPDPSVDEEYSFQVAASGGSGYRGWSILSGPSWISIDQDTGLLHGKPTAPGSESVTIQVADSFYPLLSDTRTYSFWTVKTVVRQDFEKAATSWTCSVGWTRGTRDPSSSTDRNYVGPYKAHSGLYCCGTNMTGVYNDTTGWNGSITSPALDLSTVAFPVLVYYQWMQTEPGDGGNIKVSTTGTGGPFNVVLTVTPPYNGTLGVQSAWTGFHVSPTGWRRVVVDLSTYAGQPSVIIRWNFYTNNNSIANPGWYVDSVHVFDALASPAPSEAERPTPADGITYAPPLASDYSSGLTLRWELSRGAATYDLYIGTDYSTVSSAAVPDQTGLVGGTALVAGLASGNTYYWRVDSVGSSVTKGRVWSFSTADPIPVLVNEVQMYGANTPYLEIYNPSMTVSQDLSGYELNTTSGGSNLNAFAIPAGVILSPLEARPFGSATMSLHMYEPYRAWAAIAVPFNFGWTSGTSEGEAWILDPAGQGIDYVGWNLVVSNKPSELAWSGALTHPGGSYAILRRKTSFDTDRAADFKWDLYYSYGPAYGYMGLKDPGQ